MKDTLKQLVIGSPVEPLARAIYAWVSQCGKYDRETLCVMDRVLKPDSNCLDIGGHKGDMLAEMLRRSPQGVHHAFEPIPNSHAKLIKRFPDVAIHHMALSNESGETTFQFVVNSPALSSLRKREAAQGKQVQELRVPTERLDAVLTPDHPVHFVKIDVEGAEFHVLQGGLETLRRWKPFIVFEHGQGGADCFGVKPTDVYDLLHNECGYELTLMGRWLRGIAPLNRDQFADEFHSHRNYYFMAYPA